MRAWHFSGMVERGRRILASAWQRRNWTFYTRIAAVLLILVSVAAFGLSSWLRAPRAHAATAGVSSTPGNLYGWGLNGDGELAATTTETCSGYACSTTPIQATALANVIAVAGGSLHSLAALSDGSVWAWGSNEAGQVGPGIPVGTYSSTNTPVQVTGLPGSVIAVAAGEYHSLALTASGLVYAWGGDWYGELGPVGFPIAAGYTQTPIQVTGLPADIVAISAGGENSLALASDGSVWAWGADGAGQLGSNVSTMCGPYACSATPLQVPGLSGVTAIASGGGFNLALTQSGSVYAWGDNSYGELGNGTTTSSAAPIQVSALTNVTAIAAGGHSLALTSSGQVYAWGSDLFGELGASTTQVCQNMYLCSTSPLLVGGLPSTVKAIAVGGGFSLAWTTDGAVYSWGGNTLGELGLGFSDTDSHPIPTPITGLSGVSAIAPGADQAFVIATPTAGTSQAVASLSTSNFDFGNQQITAASQPQTFTLANTGNAAMTVSGATLTGANPSDFALFSTACLGTLANPVTIQPGGTCAFDVSFAPTATGSRSATLSVTCGAVNCPLSGSIVGNGINPVGGVSPTSLSFASEYVGTTSAAQTVTVSNNGTTNLDISGVSLGGANPGDFMYSAPTLPITITPGASASIGVTFAPKAVGSRAATLTFASNDSLHTLSVALSGTGLAPADNALSLSASPNPVRSGSKVTYTITVTNAGPGAASGLQVTDMLPSGTTFAKVTTTSGSCTAPALGGTGTVTCAVSSLAAGSSFTITLTVNVKAANGTTLSDTASVSAASYDPNTANNSVSVTTSVSKR